MIRALVVSLVFATSPVLAQTEFEGLDLSDDTEGKKGEDGKSESSEGDSAEAAGEAEAPTDPLAAPTTPRSKPASPAQENPAPQDAAFTEREIIRQDRVKSVQRKLYMKRNRLELSLLGGVAVNDPYYNKYSEALRLAYYVADTLAISGRFNYYQHLRNDDERTARSVLQSYIFASVPIWSAMGNFEWSPVYGKVAFMNSILHFDAFVCGGAGVMNSKTSVDPDRGLYPAFDLGLGMRFVARDFLAVDLALINTTYVEQPAGTTKATTQNLQMLYAGLSLFIPFKSTFREAE